MQSTIGIDGEIIDPGRGKNRRSGGAIAVGGEG
jgi:hypothetical protein